MSKQGNELVRSAQEALAHSQGRLQLKEFRADMPQKERDDLLEQLCAPDPEDSTESRPGGSSHRRSSTRTHNPAPQRQVAASGKSR